MEDQPIAYVLDAWLKHGGHCECGWHGKRRLLRGSAVLDVLDHCAATGHEPVSIPPITMGSPAKARWRR